VWAALMKGKASMLLFVPRRFVTLGLLTGLFGLGYLGAVVDIPAQTSPPATGQSPAVPSDIANDYPGKLAQLRDQPNSSNLRILVVGGHPADVFDQSGGTMAHHVARGARVYCAVMTTGVRAHDKVI